MRWTKLKQLVERGFAKSLSKRLAINSTAYGNCTCGHAWLTLDKTVVANFCTRAYWNQEMGHPPEHPNKMYLDQFASYGELSRQDAYEACWDFVHSLPIEDALHDTDPLIQTLAVVDGRLGKRRLSQVDPATLHPLARMLLLERLKAENIRAPQVAA